MRRREGTKKGSLSQGADLDRGMSLGKSGTVQLQVNRASLPVMLTMNPTARCKRGERVTCSAIPPALDV